MRTGRRRDRQEEGEGRREGGLGRRAYGPGGSTSEGRHHCGRRRDTQTARRERVTPLSSPRAHRGATDDRLHAENGQHPLRRHGHTGVPQVSQRTWSCRTPTHVSITYPSTKVFVAPPVKSSRQLQCPASRISKDRCHVSRHPPLPLLSYCDSHRLRPS